MKVIDLHDEFLDSLEEDHIFASTSDTILETIEWMAKTFVFKRKKPKRIKPHPGKGRSE